MSKEVIIYTDGACKNNPGPGGWAAILRYGEIEKTISGGDTATTNNRMELMAVIAALKMIKQPVPIKIYTDSQYVKNGITKWVHNWIKRGWRSTNGPVKNQDLWEELHALSKNHNQLEWHWVRGHNNDELNERVDLLARRAIPCDK